MPATDIIINQAKFDEDILTFDVPDDTLERTAAAAARP
jgi:hypothetical protein